VFNFGLSEIAVIAVVAVLAIGPKELPVIMAQAGRLFKRLSYMRFALSQQVDHFIHQAGLDDVKDQVNFEAPNPADLHQAAIDEAKAQAAALEAHAITEDTKKALPKPKTKKTATKSAGKKAKTSTAKKPAARKTTTKKSPAKTSKAKKTTPAKKDKA
tara:strand:- start:7156 stop:7629 length:474 start_codon:yes stop_codon:yes gene_type:complete